MVEQETIENNYDLRLRRGTLCVVDGYDHIAKVSTSIGNIFVKEIKRDKNYCYLLEKVYRELSKKNILNVPLLTQKKNYLCSGESSNFIVFEEIDGTNEVPSAPWWATVLHEIHSITIEENTGYFIPDTFFSKHHSLYLSSMEYMPKDIEKIVNCLMQSINSSNKMKIPKVLNHGDPLRSNVMKKEGKFLLIDFENVCIEPKEYDIQRHLWDFAINSPKSEIANYYKDFVGSCQIYGSVDIGLLHDIYILDFCRTLCWLYVICNDTNRTDVKRQKLELDKFVVALRKEKIIEMLDLMR